MSEPAQGRGPVAAEGVRGERRIALVRSVRTLQSRMSGVLAALLMAGLGVAALSWYYAHAFTRPERVRESARAAAAQRVQGEMVLPALGPLPPPNLDPALPAATESGSTETPLPAQTDVQLVAHAAGSEGAQPTATAAPDRRLAGAVFSLAPSGAAPALAGAPADAAPVAAPAASLGNLLVPTHLAATEAQHLPAGIRLLPKGTFLDCTLETAIDSTLPGMTSCLLAADTLSADGTEVLLARGTRLIGETRGQPSAGQARLFVLWSEARTPDGLVVPLDSPGTDVLGRAGVGGHVARHFWERFGAGILVSLLDGAVQAGVQASRGGGGTVLYAPSSQDPLSEVLREGAHIAPTLQVPQGTRIQVLVARDVDFGPVHERRRPASTP